MSAKRDYLTDKKEIIFEFGSKFPENANLHELFSELTRRLKALYNIDRGVFILRSADGENFSAVSTWNEDKVRNNISINLSFV